MQQLITPAHPLIFVHFPKAGSTSLAGQLADHLGDAFLRDYENHPHGPYKDSIAPDLPETTAAVMGHFRPARYDRVKNALRATILRHPVDNLISVYFYWRTLPWREGRTLHQRFLAESPSIEQFAKYAEYQTLMSQSYFGNYDMKRFDFIGFHETRERDIAELSRLIGIPLSADIHLNKTAHSRERESILSDTRRMKRLGDLLKHDVEFYERLYSRREGRK